MSWVRFAKRNRYEPSRKEVEAARVHNEVRFKDPGPRGYLGRGGGAWEHMANPSFQRGTSDQLAYLYPGIMGSSVPIRGVPVGKVTRQIAGKHKGSLGSALCCDPWSWYKARLMSTPSVFILGLPGLGKSSLVRKWIWGLDYFGVINLVLGDLKGEHVELVRAIGGQVIDVGRGAGHINVLDLGSALEAAAELRDEGYDAEADKLEATARARRQAAVETLLVLQRKADLLDKEVAVLIAALAELDTKFGETIPVPADLLDVIKAPTEEVRAAAGAEEYGTVVDRLVTNLHTIASGHGLGEVFGKATTVRLDVNRHAVFNVAGLDDSDEAMTAAALMLCWGIGFGEIAIANTLAEVGLREQRQWHVVVDELWRALRAAPGLPKRMDALTRLDRHYGVVRTYVSHTMDDLAALPNEADRHMAAGFVERSGMIIAFGCAASEMPRLRTAVKLTRIEQETLTSWTTPPSLSASSSEDDEWPGRGKCIVKVGNRPGIPVQIELVPEELHFHQTAKRWADSHQEAAAS